MRVISPYHIKRQGTKRRSRILRIMFAAFVAGLILAGHRIYSSEINYLNTTPRNTKSSSNKPSEKVFRVFSGEEFKELYNNFKYANTNKIIDPPFITGDEKADNKIKILAEARGYRLRRLARSTLGRADGLPLQSIAEKSWQDLKAEAAKNGIILTATWAFRTIEDQRAIFLEGLRSQGVSTQDIASGQADSLVDKVLQTYAPPGYSRHHTGFTVDLTCGTSGLTNFATTSCNEWLSRDNYINSKTFGWIPSYPEGASLQGPEPEPWEYIWVSVDALLK